MTRRSRLELFLLQRPPVLRFMRIALLGAALIAPCGRLRGNEPTATGSVSQRVRRAGRASRER